VKTLLAKKQAPKGWQYFTVHAITHHPETASGYDGKVAAEMAGAKQQVGVEPIAGPRSQHHGGARVRPDRPDLRRIRKDHSERLVAQCRTGPQGLSEPAGHLGIHALGR
jgi:hypothetical protein